MGMTGKTMLTPKLQNISDWYNELILTSKLAEHGPVRGTMILRPLGYAIWENIQNILNQSIKDLGAQNVYFPLFIPYSFLEKEQTHVESFSPELAVVTHAGGENLIEPLVVRPTSETIMYDAFSHWISSYRDLPLSINQWVSAVRWEKRPYLFFRGTEFLWQEGHSAHEQHNEAQEMVQKALDIYVDFYQTYLGIFGYAGKKSASERFGGADETYTYEMVMPDGKILQGCTSHDLGQNFSKVFNVKFQDAQGEEKYVWQTSWGFSTRSIGALIMTHGDDQGLVLPPQVAPTQVIIIPIISKQTSRKQVEELANQVFEVLESADIRVKVDLGENSPGWKFTQADLEGIALRIEIGAKEVETKTLKLVRRDSKQAQEVEFDQNLVENVNQILADIQKSLLEKSEKFTIENTRVARTYPDFKEIMNTTKGFIKAFWCEDPHCEAMIKQETKATTRCLPKDEESGEGVCIYCNKPAKYQWLFGQSY